jgi:acyl carrier protein
MLAVMGVVNALPGSDVLPVDGGVRPKTKSSALPGLPLPENIEKHVKEVIAKRFQVELANVKSKAVLLDLLKAGVGRQPDQLVPVFGAYPRLTDEAYLQGLKRQLEKEYAIKLNGEDFFKKVKTVGELVQAVQAEVNNRSQPGKGEPSPEGGVRPERPISHGIRPKD